MVVVWRANGGRWSGMERIGKYVIHKLSVTTGYAQVLFCHDPDLLVPVAIKLFDPRRVADGPLSPAQWMTRFIAEARGMAAVEHTYVTPVKVLEQLPDGRPYFVMPFFAAHLAFEIGKDFLDKAAVAQAPETDRPRHVSANRAILLLRQITSALAALHRRGMVHRWVKPSNILLTAKEGGSVRLADFSMAKFPTQNPPISDIWADPCPYTAPEQLQNASAVGPEADVFSIGALAYRFATGHPPEGDVGNAEMPETMPEQLWDFIQSAMNLDPQKRPANAGAVMPILESIQVAPKVQRDHVVTSRQTGGRF